MKRMKIPGAIAAVFLVLLLAGIPAYAAEDGEVEQKFTLKPGWNAVFLDVRPEPREPAAVFKDLPEGSSVWTWLSRESRVEFIQDPSEDNWGQPGWHVYFNVAETDFRSKLTNLYAVLGNQAYLIKVGGSMEITWTVSGRPSIRKFRWIADSFNLVGFHVAQDNQPTFEELLAPSASHAGQAVYRLNNQTAKWEFVEDLAAARPRYGEAFWVYCEGRSYYQGPLAIDLPLSTGLNYGTNLTRLTVTVDNLTDAVRTVSMNLSGSVILYYRDWDPTNGSGYFTWKNVDKMSITLDPGRSRNVWLEVRREQMDPGLHLGILEINDDMGNRFLVPVRAEEVQ
jgi:hypothetical protein